MIKLVDAFLPTFYNFHSLLGSSIDSLWVGKTCFFQSPKKRFEKRGFDASDYLKTRFWGDSTFVFQRFYRFCSGDFLITEAASDTRMEAFRETWDDRRLLCTAVFSWFFPQAFQKWLLTTKKTQKNPPKPPPFCPFIRHSRARTPSEVEARRPRSSRAATSPQAGVDVKKVWFLFCSL